MPWIGQAATHSDWRNNIISDGQLVCTYDQLPTIFRRIEQHFARQGVTWLDCLAVECGNRLTDALLLLYLLERGQDFVLLPAGFGDQESRPRFCRYRLTTIAEQAIIDQPTSYLQFKPLAVWTEAASSFKDVAKLYLRTSGSTGAAKLVVHAHQHMIRSVQIWVQRCGLRSDDRVAIPVPLHHMFGLLAAFLSSIWVGAAVDIQPEANILHFMQRERAFRPTVLFLTPKWCEALLAVRKSDKRFRLTVTAGERISAPLFQKYETRFGLLLNQYGLSEFGGVTCAHLTDPLELRAQTVGQALPGVSLRLSLPEGSHANHDAIGRLECQHPYPFLGIVDQSGQALQPDPFTADDWYLTQDLARIRADGYVEILGRADFCTNRNGMLVIFSEVERIIEQLDGVAVAVLVSVGQSRYGQGLVACCLPAKGQALSAETVRDACFKLLPRHAVPDRVIIIKSLPTLVSGKVDRQQLASLLTDTHAFFPLN